jgi:hypothetical protein
MNTQEQILRQPLSEFIEDNLPPRMAGFFVDRSRHDWVPTVQTIFKASDPYRELSGFRGIGEVAAKEITKKLQQLGFEINGPVPRRMRPENIARTCAWRRKQLAMLDDKISRHKAKLTKYHRQRKELIATIAGLQP